VPESVLVVGLGQIGMGYDLSLDPDKCIYSHARAFSLHPAFELVGAVDPSSENRRSFELHYGKPSHADLADAIGSHRPRVVVIAAPTVAHAELIGPVLQSSGVSSILCEKPLAYSLGDARKIVKDCCDAGVALFVNYMRRVDTGVLEVKRRIDDGVIAAPVKGNVWYSKGFLHNGSHFFNLLEFWLGAFVSAKVIDKGRNWGSDDVEPDVHVEFERGKAVFRSAWEESFSHYTIELLSPSGRLRYEQGGSCIQWQGTVKHPRLNGYTVLQAEPTIIENSMARSQWQVADQLARYLDGRRHSLCSGAQALATLEAMHYIINLR